MWYQKLNFTRTQAEDDAFEFVQDNWSLGSPVTNSQELLYDIQGSTTNDDSNNNEYIVSFGERYPKRSRDYQDNGIYVEVIRQKDSLDPLIVNVYDWSHCSCNSWDDGISTPNKIYRFSDYIREMQKISNINKFNYLIVAPLKQNIVTCDEDDELYAFREIVQYYLKYIQPDKDRQKHKKSMSLISHQIVCSPPSKLLPSGGLQYQEALTHFLTT